MKRLFSLLCLSFFALCSSFAQDIPVEQQDRNTYSFKVPSFIVVQDFEFISAVTTDQPDVYIINLRAINANREVDTKVNGKLLFEINDVMLPVDFRDGIGQVRAEIKGTNEIKMRAVDSDITHVGTIEHPFGWGKIAGLALAVAVLGLVIWQIQKRKNRK
ncbi:hypothetical protein [Adhaeribacter soli]|uniref:LPXTG cell wall anchor domain-containing protein n=1 Tax=Adhaeribacter soli TaxID=2607655 RepID=A0A5N1IV31_9BACT|nr:hypothetical protein [Adhaeribacter soli]KAA9333598.1 hypothetical protein F0P94_10105 [Adhaeribacter soli]